MRLDFRSIFRQAIIGGICGLLGWCVISILSASSSAVIGLLLGLCFSLSQPVRQVIMDGRTIRRISSRLPLVMLAGAISGLMGVFVGELLFQLFDFPIWPRAIGWGLFGLGAGAASALLDRSFQSLMFGAVGGLIGGLLGGSSYEALAAVAISSGMTRSLAIALGGSLGLTVLGCCICGMIALVELVLRNAWLRVLNGARAGQSRTLSRSGRGLLIGRAEASDLCIRGDQKIANRHVVIAGTSAGFTARAQDPGQVSVLRQGKVISQPEVLLQDGDLVCIGDTQARFQSSQLR